MTLWGKVRAAPEGSIASVARNLESVLGAKQELGVVYFNMGVPDVRSDVSGVRFLKALMAGIHYTVAACEPRLSGMQLSHESADGALVARFVLRGNVDGRPCAFTIHYHLTLRFVTVSYSPEEIP